MSYVDFDGSMTEAELHRRVTAMSDEEQAHFKLLIHKLVMCYGEGQAQGVNAANDSVWYEINGVMTQAAISCAAGDIIGSTFTFVTTGEIKLRVQTTTWGDLLLNSAGDRMVLSTADADILELGEKL